MNTKTKERFDKVNIHMRLIADCEGRRDLVARLDRLAHRIADVDTLVSEYKAIAAALGQRSLVAAVEACARKDEEDPDGDGDNEEERCECRCERCMDGNHERCLRDDECGYGNDSDYLKRHPDEMMETPEDTDQRNLRRLEALGAQIKRDRFRAGEMSLDEYVSDGD
jgi:hypothetical protein